MGKVPEYVMRLKTLTNIKNQWKVDVVKCGASICLEKSRVIKVGDEVHRSIGYHRLYHQSCWNNMLI